MPGMKESDVIIVGGSFAGLTCARAAATRGLDVVVLERKPEIGYRPHTTGILVKEAADVLDLPQTLTRKIAAIRLYAGRAQVDLEAPGYYFTATDTPGVLRHLATHAELVGAEIETGRTFRHSEWSGSGHYLRDLEMQTRFLVGADGARSLVAGSQGVPTPQRFLTGVEFEFRGIRGLSADHLHVFLDADLAPGYIAWAFEGVGIQQIGLAVSGAGDLRRSALFEKLGQYFDFSKAECIGKRGGKIPSGGRRLGCTLPGALLLGDAAGCVSPVTGGGIHPALLLGRAGGIALADHLLDNGPHPQMLVDSLGPRYASKRLLRAVWDRFPWLGRVPEWAMTSRCFRAIASAIFFHGRSPWTLRELIGISAPEVGWEGHPAGKKNRDGTG